MAGAVPPVVLDVRRLQARRRLQRQRRLVAMGILALIVVAGGLAIWLVSLGGTARRVHFVVPHIVLASPGGRVAPPRPAIVPNLDHKLLQAVPARDAVLAAGNDRKWVAITFDDGPSTYTRRILAVLDRWGAHATFFVVGRNALGRGGILRAEIAGDNVIGDHTYDHADLDQLVDPQIVNELTEVTDFVHRTTGETVTLARPPYGGTSIHVNQLIRHLGMVPVLWSVDARDWALPGVKKIVRTALGGVRPGAIILLHDGGGNREQTLDALPLILRGLRRRGYISVTLPRLLEASPPSPHWLTDQSLSGLAIDSPKAPKTHG